MPSTTHSRSRRFTSLLGASALALALVPGVVAADEHDLLPAARDIDGVCPAPEDAAVQAPAPSDVGGVHADAIDCALDYGLVRGFEDATYRPGADVTRGQMATFIRGWIEVATGTTLEVPTEDAFPDVAGNVHRDAIAALESVGVVAGRADGTFGPGAAITRGQMARFMGNALDVADDREISGSLPPADATAYFADAVDSFFQADIQAIAGVGIVQGDTDGTYDPGGTVTRGQLAAFVMRGADYLDRLQRWSPTALAPQTYTLTLSSENALAIDADTGEVTFGVGEQGATATATLTIDAFAGTVEYAVDYGGVTGPFGDAAGLHIHDGDLDQIGGIAVFLADGPTLAAADGQTISGTVTEDSATFRLADIVADPAGHYLNLHSNMYPGGAVRGQLPDGGQDLIPSVVDVEVTLSGDSQITVDAETGEVTATGVGEAGATAEAFVRVDALRGVITYELDVSGVTGPFAENAGFHIHVGTATENGPVVVFLASGAEVAAAEGQVLTGTFTEADLPLDSTLRFRELLDDPAGYYLNLHSAGFPAGAVRAQLG